VFATPIRRPDKRPFLRDVPRPFFVRFALIVFSADEHSYSWRGSMTTAEPVIFTHDAPELSGEKPARETRRR